MEDIREGIAAIIKTSRKDKFINVPHLDDQIACNIMAFLHEQGVVRKVDRELPKNAYHPLGWFYDLYNTYGHMGTEEADKPETDAYNEAQMDMVVAGYVAVEPLVKEE